MRRIIYYVAASIDGFISGPDEDISGFENVQESDGIQMYLQDLQKFDSVIMGRKTYEFGYKFGLKPGDLAYPHMNHYIFSGSLKLDSPDKDRNLQTGLGNCQKIKRPGRVRYLFMRWRLFRWMAP
jgi:dihydrofolate reductase